MKKTITLCLLFALLLSSCGGATTETTAQSTTAAETTVETEPETSILESLGEKDFAGGNFVLMDINATPDLHVNLPTEELTGDLVGDALYERDLYIEETYNISLDYIQSAPGDNLLKKSVTAGDNAYQAIIGGVLAANFQTLATEGVLANLCLAEDLTLDAPWWSKLMYDSMRIDDIMYITCGDIAPAIYQAPCCYFLNLALLDEMGIDTDIFNLVTEGKWTLDAVYNLTADTDRDENGDGKMDLNDDFYGVVMQPTNETSDALMTAVNHPLCADKNGTLALALDEAAETTIEKIRNFAKKIPYKGINDVINITFKESRALLLQHKLESAGVHLRDMEDPYLILPMPKRDELQESYISCVSGYVTGFVVLPKTADLAYSGFITEALARYSHEKVRPLAYDMVYTAKTTRDSRTADVLNIIFDTLYLDFNTCYNFGGVSDAMTNIIFNDKPFASSIAAIETKTAEAIAKFTENWQKNG